MTFPRLVEASPVKASPLSERNDDELMALCQAGLREAFAVLVRRHAIRIVNVCTRFTADRQLGVELAQETWATVWERRAQYRAESGFPVWLITVARNRCRNHLRGARVGLRHESECLALTPPPSPDQIDLLLVEERRRKVRDALARVPRAMREALLLRYAEDLRYDEMTLVLNVGESTLRSRVHHGLKALRALLERGR